MSASSDSESRFPVGSSARISDGSPIKARATAARCLLAARQLCRIMLRSVPYADFLKERLRLFGALRRSRSTGSLAVSQRKFDILQNREVTDQVERLEHETEFLIPQARPTGEAKMPRIAPQQQVLAARRLFQQTQNR